MSRMITVEHDGNTYSGKVALITSTALTYEDHGILTAYLHAQGDGWGIAVGGYCLDTTTGAPEYKREGTAFGLDHLIRLMETVGVSKWEDAKGREVIILFPKGSDGWGGSAVGIAHVTDEKRVLDFKAHAESWKIRDEAAKAGTA